jgi:hypothetical protein
VFGFMESRNIPYHTCILKKNPKLNQFSIILSSEPYKKSDFSKDDLWVVFVKTLNYFSLPLRMAFQKM